jgi:hypothetical protein
MFIHTVYFWLNEGTSEAAKQQLIDDCRGILRAVPTVRQLYAGAPAMTPRDVVDNSYQVGLTVILDDDAAHDVYQKHPLHLDFIARNKAHWNRVKVFDFRA